MTRFTLTTLLLSANDSPPRSIARIKYLASVSRAQTLRVCKDGIPVAVDGPLRDYAE